MSASSASPPVVGRVGDGARGTSGTGVRVDDGFHEQVLKGGPEGAQRADDDTRRATGVDERLNNRWIARLDADDIAVDLDSFSRGKLAAPRIPAGAGPQRSHGGTEERAHRSVRRAPAAGCDLDLVALTVEREVLQRALRCDQTL